MHVMATGYRSLFYHTPEIHDAIDFNGFE